MAISKDNLGANLINVYAGNTAGSDPNYKVTNTLCHFGYMEGLVDCGKSVSARYIIFELTENDSEFMVGEVLAWDEPNITIDSCTLSYPLAAISMLSGNSQRMFNTATDINLS